jgi:hypothetical protein
MADPLLPLKLDNRRNIEALFIGLEDERIRGALATQRGVPDEVKQLICLVEDEKFLSMASDVIEKIRRLDRGRPKSGKLNLKPPKRGPEPKDLREIRAEASVATEYITQRYPQGVALLRRFGESAFGSQVTLQAWFAVNLDVAANAEALVNAAAYTNVAVATFVFVAAAVVVFAVII